MKTRRSVLGALASAPAAAAMPNEVNANHLSMKGVNLGSIASKSWGPEFSIDELQSYLDDIDTVPVPSAAPGSSPVIPANIASLKSVSPAMKEILATQLAQAAYKARVRATLLQLIGDATGIPRPDQKWLKLWHYI